MLGRKKFMTVFLQKNRKICIEELKNAIVTYPELIAGEERLCTKIIKKTNGRLIVKVGADGVYTAILLDKGLGLALKICDGSKKAAECLIVTLLIRLGYLKSDDKDFLNYFNIPIYNWSKKKTGTIRACTEIWENGKLLDL